MDDTTTHESIDMNWYSLRVMSGREEKVRDTIFRELDYEKELRSTVEEILIPTENVVDIKNGKKQLKKKVFFPGYVLVKMDMNNETKFFIESMDGVMSFVGPKGNPQALNDSEIKRIIGSRSHSNQSFDNWVNKNFSNAEIVQAGSSLKFCLIAEGVADIYPRFGPTSEWDIAAGHIIVDEAGGRVSTFENNEINYNSKEDLLNPQFYAIGNYKL